MSIRHTKFDQYGISRNRYKELKAFCLQYAEKKSMINRTLSGVNCDGMPKGTGKKDGLENNAIRNVMYERDCQMIEQAAEQAGSSVSKDFYKFILKSVTNDLSYAYIEWIDSVGRIPVGPNEFYGYRRLFYHILDVMQRCDKLDPKT